MKIRLSDQFSYRHLLRFTFPSIVMMVFSSIYGVVDGFFVSNFVGKTEFAAVNFIFPYLMILGAAGFMFGTGGSALIAKTLGEGKNEEAKKQFSLIVYSSIVSGFIIALLGVVTLRPVSVLLGAEGAMLENAVTYGLIYLSAMPAYVLQYEFQSLFITAEKPKIGLFVMVFAGVTNMVLDALLTAVFPFGIVGAALATAISQVAGGVIPLLYFSKNNSSLLRLTKTTFDKSILIKVCLNGSSELMSNLSMSLVSMLYNYQLMKYAGEDGIAAYGVLMYVSMIFIAIFIGYAVGSSPIVSYHYGAGNTDELKSIRKKSIVLITIASVFMVILALVLARPLSSIFVGYDKELYNMTVRGFHIYAFSFLFSGIAIWGSSFFTSLNNGLVSALISFLRTLLFQLIAVLLLPLIWQLDGIWISIVVAEVMAVIVTGIFLFGLRKKYGYS